MNKEKGKGKGIMKWGKMGKGSGRERDRTSGRGVPRRVAARYVRVVCATSNKTRRTSSALAANSQSTDFFGGCEAHNR
eukprot:scaffold34984_cov101-Isochrysis_galbana.AAC.5